MTCNPDALVVWTPTNYEVVVPFLVLEVSLIQWKLWLCQITWCLVCRPPVHPSSVGTTCSLSHTVLPISLQLNHSMTFHVWMKIGKTKIGPFSNLLKMLIFESPHFITLGIFSHLPFMMIITYNYHTDTCILQSKNSLTFHGQPWGATAMSRSRIVIIAVS